MTAASESTAPAIRISRSMEKPPIDWSFSGSALRCSIAGILEVLFGHALDNRGCSGLRRLDRLLQRRQERSRLRYPRRPGAQGTGHLAVVAAEIGCAIFLNRRLQTILLARHH